MPTQEDSSFYYPARMSLIGGIVGGVLATAGVIAGAILSKPVEKTPAPHAETHFELFAPPAIGAQRSMFLIESSTGRTWTLDYVPEVPGDKKKQQAAKPAYSQWVRVDTVAVTTP